MIHGSQPLVRDQQTKINIIFTQTLQWILINSTSQTWNSEAIRALVDPKDAKII